MLVGKAGHRKVEAVAISLASGLNYAADNLVMQSRENLLDTEELLGELDSCIETMRKVLNQYKQEVKGLYDEFFE